MLGLAVLGPAEDEHLRLAELVNPVEPATFAPVGARLGAKAMGYARQADGQFFFVQDAIGQHPAQGNFGGAHQAEIVARDGVDLGFLTAGVEAQTGEDGGPGQVRGGQGGEAFFHHTLEGKALQGQFQQGRFVLQVVELLPRYLGRGFEIQQVVFFAERDVIQGFEVEGLGGSRLDDFERILSAPGYLGVDEVGHLHHQGFEFLFAFAKPGLDGPHFFLEAAPLGDMGLALGVFHGAFAGLLVLVAQAIRFVELRAKGRDFVLGRDGLVDIGPDAPVGAALGNLVAFFTE